MARKQAPRASKPPSELTRLSQHIDYEFQMLISTAAALPSQLHLPKSLEDLIKNALLESFLIHARSLYHFLFSDRLGARIKDTDFIAQDYAPKWQGNYDHQIKAEYDRVNWEIAHLTK